MSLSQKDNFSSHAKRQTFLDNINNLGDLSEFSKENSKYHRIYFHYTKLEFLQNIIETGYVFLSKADQMNDMAEVEHGDKEIWDRTYIFSLSFGYSESVAHWYIYSGGVRKKGVRLGIPKSQFIDWIESIEGVFPVNESNIPTEKILDVEPTEVLDVMYVFKNNNDELSLKMNEYRIINLFEQFNCKGLNDLMELQGHLKDLAWEFENETRIKIVLKKKIENNRIAIKLPKSLIESFKITCNPWISSDEVKNNNVFQGISVENSNLMGTINHLGNAK